VPPATKTKPAASPDILHRDLMQATPASAIPTGEWVFELKLDGFRCLAVREAGRLRLLSRQGNDMAACFPEVVFEFRDLPGDVVLDGELVVLDGELVVLDERRKPQFERLCRRARMSRGITVMKDAAEDPAALFAFDLLWCKGKDLRKQPLIERKRLLQDLLHVKRLKYAQHIDDGDRLFQFCVQLELEGIVAKRPRSVYRAGRSVDWLKIKTPIGRERERRRFDR
jgi:bifunctional non-homologous end joining protein LigD